MSHGQLKIFSGSAHPALAKEIAEQLETTLGVARLHRFPDSEVSFQIDENIRGTDVFIVQPTSTPVDQHLVELCVMIDAFRRSSAHGARRARRRRVGWGGRIRTFEYGIQSPAPYRLATPQSRSAGPSQTRKSITGPRAGWPPAGTACGSAGPATPAVAAGGDRKSVV